MNELLRIELIGGFMIFFGGVLFHFLYKYGGRKKWMAIISPVNESIWEHLKLSFYPVVLFSLLEYSYLRVKPTNYLLGEVLGIYTMIVFILFVEWLYPKFTKKNIFWVDILIFFIAVILSQIISFLVMQNFNVTMPDIFLCCILIIQILIFALFTFFPPKLPIFKDSVDGQYGIKRSISS